MPVISIVDSGEVPLVCLNGRIDIDSSPAVRNRLLVLLQSRRPAIVRVDLSGVTHLDSSGVATLLEALKIARGNGTELTLQALPDPLLRLFGPTGILALFNGTEEA